MSRNSQLRMFDFRMGADDHDRYCISETLNLLGKRWCFQLEKGEESGYLHFQGRVSLRKKEYADAAKRLVLSHLPSCRYFRPTSNPIQRKGDFFYVLKIQTRVEGPWTDKDVETYVPKQFRLVPRPWQLRILDEAGFNYRLINCLIDFKGNVGKSVLAGLARARGFYTIPVCCDAKEIIQSVCDIFTARRERDPKLVLVDLPRAVNKHRQHALFTAIESIKNGWVYDIRYHWKEWTFDSPALWVFSNHAFENFLEYGSGDRWKFWSLREGNLVQVDHMGNEPMRSDVSTSVGSPDLPGIGIFNTKKRKKV